MVAHMNSLQIKLLLYKLSALETSLVLLLPLIKRKLVTQCSSRNLSSCQEFLHGEGLSLPSLTLAPAGTVWVQPLQGCCLMENCPGALWNDSVLKFMNSNRDIWWISSLRDPSWWLLQMGSEAHCELGQEELLINEKWEQWNSPEDTNCNNQNNKIWCRSQRLDSKDPWAGQMQTGIGTQVQSQSWAQNLTLHELGMEPPGNKNWKLDQT